MGYRRIPHPPPLPSNDGSGAHGAGGSASIGDHASKQLWYDAADGAEIIGYDDTARHMRHYLDNSGTPLNVDPDKMLREIPGFKQKSETVFQTQLIDQINQQIASKYNGQPMTFQVTTDWAGYYAEEGNWFYASGGYSFAYGAEVKVTPDANGQPHVNVDYQMHVYDRYNWDKGKGVKILGIPIPDTMPGHLHDVGLAQEYDLKGSTPVRNYMYTYPGQLSK